MTPTLQSLALCGLLAALPCLAADEAPVPKASPEPARASAEAVLRRFLDACGGQAAVRSLRNSVLSGTIAIPAQNLKGTVQAWRAEPDKMLVMADLPGIGKIEEGYDGTTGWLRDPMTGARFIEGRELDQLRNQSVDVAKLADLEAVFASMSLAGRVTWNGSLVDRLELETVGGTKMTTYFDPVTGFQVGMEMNAATPAGDIPATWVLSDYKPFGKVKIATSIRNTTMGTDQIISIDAVRLDLAEEDLPSFGPPPGLVPAPTAPVGAGGN